MRGGSVYGISVSDVHLSHKPPVARSSEPDWYASQAGYLRQLKRASETCNKLAVPVPIIFAGDLFDDGWRPHRCPPELINFAIENVPVMYGVPGQHDLPYHRYEDIHKSAYWTLVKAGKIIPLEPDNPVEVGNLRLHGFPWGHPVSPLKDPHDLLIEVAVVHSYVFTKTTGHPGADPNQRVKGYDKNLKGYDIALFGDNHTPFQSMSKCGCLVYNNGGFMRRKSDEVNCTPSVGLIKSDKTMERKYLDVSKDKFLDREEIEVMVGGGIDAEDLINELNALGDAPISFKELLSKALDSGVREGVRQAVLRAMG